MVSRRDFLKLGVATAAGAPALAANKALAHETNLKAGGEDFSYLSGTEREPIATACALCASRCAAIGSWRGRLTAQAGHIAGTTRSPVCPDPDPASDLDGHPDRHPDSDARPSSEPDRGC